MPDSDQFKALLSTNDIKNDAWNDGAFQRSLSKYGVVEPELLSDQPGLESMYYHQGIRPSARAPGPLRD